MEYYYLFYNKLRYSLVLYCFELPKSLSMLTLKKLSTRNEDQEFPIHLTKSLSSLP